MSAARRFIATIDMRSGHWLRACGIICLLAVMPLSPSCAQDQPPLIAAVMADDLAGLTKLIADSADIDSRDAQGRTALLVATHADNVEAAKALIAAGADVNAKDAIEDTPYLYAAAEGRLEILELCLAHGANLKDTNRYGGTGLIPAAHHGHPQVVRRLLQTDIDIDHVNKLGWTALLEAVILGDGGPIYQEIVGDLVKAGAKPIADREGQTPLDHARQRGFTRIAAILQGR